MTEHPEFPNETPAIRYLVDQVSKIEDAQACGMGYYKSLSKVLARLDKTDIALNQLKDSTKALQSVVDTDLVATVIGKKSDEINETLRSSVDSMLGENVKTISARLLQIEYENKKVTDGFVHLTRDIESTNKKLKDNIASVSNCLVIPTWKAWGIVIVTLVIGVCIGKWVL